MMHIKTVPIYAGEKDLGDVIFLQYLASVSKRMQFH